MSILKGRAIWIALVLWLILWGLAGEVQADSAGFQGYVTDLASGEAISGAVVEAGDARVISDPHGRFVLRPGTGVYDVVVHAEGYIGMRKTRLRLDEGEQLEVNFEMIPQQPTAAQEAALAEKLSRPQQEISGTVTERALQGEVAAAAVTQVPNTIRVLMPDDEVVVMNMDEYLKGVVPREVPPHWPEEALKAQAVAARSYASVIKAHPDEGADVCTTVHCQAWSNTHYDTTDQAVDDTHGVSVRYAGNIIYAFFFGHCDGRTRSCVEVWGSELPYLQSIECPCGFEELWGHGVGMCQEGARTLAEDGLSYDQILAHYYLDTQVEGPEPAQLSDSVVMPEQGDQDTLFTFRVRYESPNDVLPAVANLIVDGAAFPMLLLEEAVDGSLLYSAQLSLAVGEHSYRFSFDDGYGNLALLPASGTFQGPTVGSPGSGQQGETDEFPALDEATFGTRSDWEQGAMQSLHAVSSREGGIALDVGTTQGIWTSPAVSFAVTPTALAAAWYGDTPAQSDVSLVIRTKDMAEGAWSAWRTLPVSEDDQVEAHVRRSRLAYAVGPICQLRLTLEAGAEAVSPLVWDLRVSALATEDTSPLDTGPEILTRAEWGADEDLMRWEPVYRQPRVIVLHHTGMDLADAEPAAALRAEYLYSALIRGYGDIGYNYLVGPDGQIYEGRYGGAGVVGRHAGRYDWGSIGIALLGNYGGVLPTAVETALVDLLTQLCREQGIDPKGETYFVDGTFPNLMAHSECGATSCLGVGLQDQLADVRSQVAARLAPSPGVSFSSPPAGSVVRAVVAPGFDVTGTITRTRFYVDGQLDWSSTDGGLDWRWNTTAVSDGLHTISVTACNDNGCAGAERSLLVDNLAPTGSVTVAAWITDTLVPFSIDSEDVLTVQFSNGWVWEGEGLYHAEDSGSAVLDAEALNGVAWRGSAGEDAPGGWYGPYVCSLPDGERYDVCYRLKTSDNTAQAGLCTLDVADSQGERVYTSTALAGWDFAHDDAYETFCLPLDYQDKAETCQTPGRSDGLEFRTWYSGLGDLYLDRVTLYGAAQALGDGGVATWSVLDQEGEQPVRVRLLDAAGNALESKLVVRVDRTAPAWLELDGVCLTVQDVTSGLAPDTAEWCVSESEEGGCSVWQPLDLTCAKGTTSPVVVCVPDAEGAYLHVRLHDVAGNFSVSPPSQLEPVQDPAPSLRLFLPLIMR